MDQKERYNQIWECGDVIKPEKWSAWEIVKDFQNTVNLEIGPGNYPKIPIKNGYFLDVSETCLKNLKKLGAKVIIGDAINLPFENNFFDLVTAIEVLEHIKDDTKVVAEIQRVLKPSGYFLFSVPLRKDSYTEWDQIAGHERRYEIEDLEKILSQNKFKFLKYRYPSLYPKVIDTLPGFFRIKRTLFKSKGCVNSFHSPKFLVNLYSKSYAFLERKGAPKWQTDIENLSNYKEKAIVLFCQKI